MKRTILIASGILVVLILVYADQNRNFYNLENGKCFTIWKRIGGTCYIIPGKYWGVNAPDSFVKAKNSGIVTLFFSASQPDNIFVEGQGLELANEGLPPRFVAKNLQHDELLYITDARTASDLKPDAYRVDMDLGPLYVIDYKGHRIKSE